MTVGLAELQQWMQEAILAGETRLAPAHVRASEQLGAEARLGIYAGGYRQRLLECLRGEYPLLAKLAGPTAFDLFARGYIAIRPSRSYTLYDFGAGFADYLDWARPAGDGAPHAPEAIPGALARIERARAEVLRAQGVERRPIDPLAGIFGHAGGYRRPDSLRLLALAFDFAETLAAAEQPGPPPPRPAPSLIAVARARYRVDCHALTDWQYGWLAGLPGPDAERGAPANARVAPWLGSAIEWGLVEPVP